MKLLSDDGITRVLVGTKEECREFAERRLLPLSQETESKVLEGVLLPPLAGSRASVRDWAEKWRVREDFEERYPELKEWRAHVGTRCSPPYEEYWCQWVPERGISRMEWFGVGVG